MNYIKYLMIYVYLVTLLALRLVMLFARLLLRLRLRWLALIDIGLSLSEEKKTQRSNQFIPKLPSLFFVPPSTRSKASRSWPRSSAHGSWAWPASGWPSAWASRRWSGRAAATCVTEQQHSAQQDPGGADGLYANGSR